MSAAWVADPQVCAAYAADASGLRHTPDAVSRPEREAEVVESILSCGARGLPVTAQGLRSSTTGASVAEQGVVLSLERMGRILEVDATERWARVEPGVVLGDFKREVEGMGLFYPPDPTSENECTIGGTIATNASGARTYRYGSTRGYVKGLRVVTADGAVHDVERRVPSKNATGYFGFQNPVDLWIGSEGTLGIVTQIDLHLLPGPPRFFAGLVFFPDVETALRFVLAADEARIAGRLRPRCLELFDRAALDLAAGAQRGHDLRVPERAGAALYFEEELGDAQVSARLEPWGALIDRTGGLADDTVVAERDAAIQELRRLRHAIPAGMNERGALAQRNGGRKVSTDFAVPLPALPRLMARCTEIGRDFGGPTIAYGHVGNGHPHFNLLAGDPVELERAEAAVLEMARCAVALGGTLSAEHGIGKVKRAALRELYPSWMWTAMRAVKLALDPRGLLAPGNLFLDGPDVVASSFPQETGK